MNGVDSTPPTAPTNLSDTVGVSGYAIWRNNAPIGSTTETGYTDGSATSGVTYTYYVVAQDKAGNVAAASNSVTVKR